jgi:TMEM175 potassium channel family protein
MAEHPNARLEAFCDGVFAIALTLLVIDISIPATAEIRDTGEFWTALGNILPSIFAFLLSFIVIFITWVNHHAVLRLVARTSPSFIYANGLLLLTVVFVPFPTALLGEYLLTDHSAPAVVLYNAVLALQAVAWILLGGAALHGRLIRDDESSVVMRANTRNGYFAFAIYAVLAIAAFWIPEIIAAVTAASWAFWLIYGITIQKER